MSEGIGAFGATASGLSKNPLGVIALFLVLVYGMAVSSLVVPNSLTPAERILIVYFAIVFPFVVLGVFAWLVSQHSGRLFAPSDFRNEENYIIAQQQFAVAALTAASSKSSAGVPADGLKEIVSVVQAASSVASKASGQGSRKILWVDDRPENNVFERQAFEAVGLTFTLSLNTEDALNQLALQQFAAVISDMGRKEGPQEGYALLDDMRRRGDKTPVFFYAGSNDPEHTRLTIERGGNGNTNNANELFKMVTKSVIESKYI